MTKEEWKEVCSDASVRMIEHIKPYLTPISKVLSDEEGQLLGSGSYIESNENKYLISNEHVLKYLANITLAHQFFESDVIIKLTNQTFYKKAPADVAISKISSQSWGICEHKAKAIPLERFSSKHKPIKNEALFFAGHSGERSQFLFGNLCTTGTPYLTQECPFPTTGKDADPEFHFSLFYLPDLAESIDGTSNLPDPHGFSGSLVWDTKLVSCLQNDEKWSPEMAKVTGIVWGWPSSSGSVLATKVEHMGYNELIENEKIKA